MTCHYAAPRCNCAVTTASLGCPLLQLGCDYNVTTLPIAATTLHLQCHYAAPRCNYAATTVSLGCLPVQLGCNYNVTTLPPLRLSCNYDVTTLLRAATTLLLPCYYAALRCN